MKMLKEEKGSIIAIFTLCLVILIFFVGIAIDFGAYYMKKNDLENLCRIVREDRFIFQDTVKYSDNPAAEFYNIVQDTMNKNGFKGNINVYFKEEAFTAYANSRSYKMRVELSEPFSFSFLKIFGLSSVMVEAHIDGKENYGESGNDVIWHPGVNVNAYNGRYSGKAGSTYSFSPGVFPVSGSW